MYRDHHLGFTPEEKSGLSRLVKDIAGRCGEVIHDREIEFPGLKKDGFSHDALMLSDGDATEYCEFPFDPRGSEETKMPRPDLHETVFHYILKRMAADLRNRCLKVDGTPNAHDDATRNTIWNERHVARKPDMQIGMSIAGGILKISARLGKGGRVLVEHDKITMPDILPESVVAGHRIRELGEILQMPHCGDDAAQAAFENQYVYSIDRMGDTVVLSTGGTTHAVRGHEGVYPWRELRRMRRDCMVLAKNHDPITYDTDGDIEKFVAGIRDFFGRNGTPEDHYLRKKAA